ncbi:MAG: ATPase, T2SS/T4P/T4SS family, partial [Halobacteriota archaeon]
GVVARAPAGASLVDAWDLQTGASVRLYEVPGGRVYHLDPVENDLTDIETATLAAARACLARGEVAGGPRVAGRAVRRVVGDDQTRPRARGDDCDADSVRVETLSHVLQKHTQGLGFLEDLLADPGITDVFVTAPVADNPVRVTVDGESATTNVRLSSDGVASLASQVRRRCGRAFSRASPTVDASVETLSGDRVRVSGVTAPASAGYGFAFRTAHRSVWTLPALVANETLPAKAASLLSVATERAGAGLVAGPRGAGKTTLLGALLWEIPRTTRTVVIEDTPELPVKPLQRDGRDVQALGVTTGDGPSISPTEAVRAALRLGEGALVVGEVRGEEANALYEAMRVGATASAVLGTIHGEDAPAVRERVVTDLGVPSSSFMATDFLVSLSTEKRVSSVVELRADGPTVTFEPLFERRSTGLESTGTIRRGNSRLVEALASDEESYADVLDRLEDRERLLRGLASTDRTSVADLAVAYRGRDER